MDIFKGYSAHVHDMLGWDMLILEELQKSFIPTDDCKMYGKTIAMLKLQTNCQAQKGQDQTDTKRSTCMWWLISQIAVYTCLQKFFHAVQRHKTFNTWIIMWIMQTLYLVSVNWMWRGVWVYDHSAFSGVSLFDRNGCIIGPGVVMSKSFSIGTLGSIAPGTSATSLDPSVTTATASTAQCEYVMFSQHISGLFRCTWRLLLARPR